MFRPVKMELVNLLLLKEDLPRAGRALAAAGCLEVEKPRVLEGNESLRQVDTHVGLAELSGLRSRIESVAATLKIPSRSRRRFDISDLRVAPRDIRALVESEYSRIETEARRLHLQIQRDREALSKVDLTAWVVSSLAQRRVDPVLVTGPVYIGVQIGTLPSEEFARTRQSMHVAGHQLYGLGTLGTRTFACAVTTADHLTDMAGGLRSARFEPVAIRKDLVRGGHFDAQAAELEMWETRERLTENGLALLQLAKRSEAQIHKWLAEIDLNARLLEAMNDFLEGDYTCLITGWVPTRNLRYLRKELEGACENPVEFVTAVNGEIAAEGPGPLVPPTKLSNPRIFRPFELIIDLYGTPAYRAINPTPFVALTFTFIFGAMFGDVGHGLVLVLAGAAGLFLADRKSGIRDLGGVLVGCGLSAIVFGFLYGSFFGYESFEPLWCRPMSDPARFLFYGVILGAVVINLGLLINIIQNLMARAYKEAFFGEWGFTTFLFYWAAIVLFVLTQTGHKDVVTWGLVAMLLVPSLLATAFGGLIVDRLAGRPAESDIASTVFRPVELMLSSLTNTISFVRVPAFALNHAALMGSIFLLAGLIESGAGGAMVSKVDIIAGNIVVIALEGLIVFVQTMRLHYYEFFGKFFHHQGRPFTPLAFEEGGR